MSPERSAETSDPCNMKRSGKEKVEPKQWMKGVHRVHFPFVLWHFVTACFALIGAGVTAFAVSIVTAWALWPHPIKWDPSLLVASLSSPVSIGVALVIIVVTVGVRYRSQQKRRELWIDKLFGQEEQLLGSIKKDISDVMRGAKDGE